jgi:hypothetical protein
MSVADPRSFDFAGVANFLGVSCFRVSSQKTQPLILKNPRSFDFAGVANFLGVSFEYRQSAPLKGVKE